jgi:Protein of unknown function (DUF3631)
MRAQPRAAQTKTLLLKLRLCPAPSLAACEADEKGSKSICTDDDPMAIGPERHERQSSNPSFQADREPHAAPNLGEEAANGHANGHCGAVPHEGNEGSSTAADDVTPITDCLRLYHETAAGADGVFVLTIIDPMTGKVRPQQFAIGDVDSMAKEAVARSAYGNVYFAPTLLRRDLPQGKRGEFKDITVVLGLAIDDDGDTGKRAILPPTIRPSIEVTTCQRPTVNRQPHFVFSRPLPPNEAGALAELLHRKCGGDHGTKDVAHVWRLPKTLNFPNAAKIARGRPSEPQPVDLTGGSIDPDELRRALEMMPDMRPPHAARTNGDARSYSGSSRDRDEITARLPGWVTDLIETEVVEGEGDRSAHSYRTMLELMDHGLTDDEIRILATDAAFARKFAARGDIDAEIGRVRARWGGEARRMRAHAKTTGARSRTNAALDGAALLDQVYQFIGRFVSYPSDHAHRAHALWIVHTHLMDAWESTPRLAALSPEPGSGKTRLLEASELLVPRPVEAINVTPAYLFRKVGDPEGRPTILFDEIDTVFGPKAKDNEEIRGLLNAGHRRGAVAGRCITKGKIVETEEIPAYCAVALAGLGNLPDTLLSRAVVIRMRRRAPGEHVEPFRRRVSQREGHELRDQIAVWADQILGRVIDAWPAMPEGIADRDADVWEALLAVADVAGGDWPEHARVAAVTLVTLAKQSSPSLGIRLLSDLRTLFGNVDVMATDTILKKLHELIESPWGDLRGKPLNDRGLAKLLRPYDVKPKLLRIGSYVGRGYAREDLHDAWVRYLQSDAKSVTPVTGVADSIS